MSYRSSHDKALRATSLCVTPSRMLVAVAASAIAAIGISRSALSNAISPNRFYSGSDAGRLRPGSRLKQGYYPFNCRSAILGRAADPAVDLGSEQRLNGISSDGMAV
jgi:hypothetical protein